MISFTYDYANYPNCSLIPDWFGFLLWRTKGDEFEISIDDDQQQAHDFTVRLKADDSGRGWWATCPGYYGGETGSPYAQHSFISRKDALEGLIEKLRESIN